jgi:beta-phosphoglucomutase
MIKLIIFDLDGVLADTEAMHRESLLDAIKYITGLPRDDYEHLFAVDGRTTKEKLRMLQEHADLSELDLQLIDDKKQQNVIRHFFRGIKTSPNQSLMIHALSEKYKLAVASNSRKENVINILNILGITNYFERVLSNNDVINPKPNPEIFQHIMEVTGISADETLILEDSPAGRTAAIASGAHLFEVDNMEQVTLENIENAIKRINTDNPNPNGRHGEPFFASGL